MADELGHVLVRLQKLKRRQKLVNPRENRLERSLELARQELHRFQMKERRWYKEWIAQTVPAAKALVLEWFIRECTIRKKTSLWEDDLRRYEECLTPRLSHDLISECLSDLVQEGKLLSETAIDTHDGYLATGYRLPIPKKTKKRVR